MTTNRKTLGFGCPNDIDPHHFVVAIPAGRTRAVTVTEHFGLLAAPTAYPSEKTAPSFRVGIGTRSPMALSAFSTSVSKPKSSPRAAGRRG
ncbi:MAG: DUF3780 domain-containing protein [Pseudomonadota bacterium]|nr:DUF3780 domain-containing protein [Pseudomonadota bacterium]